VSATVLMTFTSAACAAGANAARANNTEHAAKAASRIKSLRIITFLSPVR
jgi:hypothetical protein